MKSRGNIKSRCDTKPLGNILVWCSKMHSKARGTKAPRHLSVGIPVATDHQ